MKKNCGKKTIIAILLVTIIVAFSFHGSSSYAKPSGERIVVDKTLHTLTHYADDGSVEHVFPISCGAPGYDSEEGNFRVVYKSMNPRWFLERWKEEDPEAKPYLPYIKDPSNPLGTRFMAFNGDYGIHGTNEPMVIGRHVSHGCIRMQITDVEKLFPTVEVGTPVELRSDPAIPWRLTNNFSSWWGLHDILNLARRTRDYKENPPKQQN